MFWYLFFASCWYSWALVFVTNLFLFCSVLLIYVLFVLQVWVCRTFKKLDYLLFENHLLKLLLSLSFLALVASIVCNERELYYSETKFSVCRIIFYNADWLSSFTVVLAVQWPFKYYLFLLRTVRAPTRRIISLVFVLIYL